MAEGGALSEFGGQCLFACMSGRDGLQLEMLLQFLFYDMKTLHMLVWLAATFNPGTRRPLNCAAKPALMPFQLAAMLILRP